MSLDLTTRRSVAHGATVLVGTGILDLAPADLPASSIAGHDGAPPDGAVAGSAAA